MKQETRNKKQSLLALLVGLLLVTGSCSNEAPLVDKESALFSLQQELEIALSIIDKSYTSIDILNDSKQDILEKISNTSEWSSSFIPSLHSTKSQGVHSVLENDIIAQMQDLSLTDFINWLENLYANIESSETNTKQQDLQIVRNYYLFSSIIHHRMDKISAINKLITVDPALRRVIPLSTKVNLGSLRDGDRVDLPDGKYPHLDDPEKYIQVVSCFVYIQKCPPGTIYIHKCQCCDWPDGQNSNTNFWDCIRRKAADGGLGAIGGVGAGAAVGGAIAGIGVIPGVTGGAVIGFIFGSGLFWDCF